MKVEAEPKLPVLSELREMVDPNDMSLGIPGLFEVVAAKGDGLLACGLKDANGEAPCLFCAAKPANGEALVLELWSKDDWDPVKGEELNMVPLFIDGGAKAARGDAKDETLPTAEGLPNEARGD